MSKYQNITLADGRNLSYVEFGRTDGVPVIYFHGCPSSFIEPLLIGNEIFINHNLRIISPNRPGIGKSDYLENRGFTDWAKDVIFLANYLGLEKFALLGNSGGGGYVAACAAKIPERLTSAVIVSGAWQMNLPEARKYLRVPYSIFWKIARKASFLLPFLFKSMKNSFSKSREKSLAQSKNMMPAPDFEALKKNDRLDILSKTINEAISNTKGAACDVRLYVHEWDFRLSDILFPITLFHGEQDRNVPMALVMKMVSQLPNASLICYENEAHLSTLCNRFDDIAAALVDKKVKEQALSL